MKLKIVIFSLSRLDRLVMSALHLCLNFKEFRLSSYSTGASRTLQEFLKKSTRVKNGDPMKFEGQIAPNSDGTQMVL